MVLADIRTKDDFQADTWDDSTPNFTNREDITLKKKTQKRQKLQHMSPFHCTFELQH
jgi:hypothetical protein